MYDVRVTLNYYNVPTPGGDMENKTSQLSNVYIRRQ